MIINSLEAPLHKYTAPTCTLELSVDAQAQDHPNDLLARELALFSSPN